MKTNDLKKGARVLLRNGWLATLQDNKKGDIRFAEVEGIYTELGSVYSHDIERALVEGHWVPVEHTEAQLKLMNQVTRLF